MFTRLLGAEQVRCMLVGLIVHDCMLLPHHSHQMPSQPQGSPPPQKRTPPPPT
jgi:hypothetical protein